MKMGGTVAAALLGVWLASAGPAGAVRIDVPTRTVTAARVGMTFGAGGPDVVSSLQWTGSGGTAGPSLVEDSGKPTCPGTSDPGSFWGESYGDGAKTDPDLVLAGSSGTWTSPAADEVETSTGFPTACSNYAASVPVTTRYTYYDEAPEASEIMVRRTWGFDLAQPPTGAATGFRAYVPRLPLKHFSRVLYPAGGGLQAVDITSTECAAEACVKEFSGTWFAIDDANVGDGEEGSGMIVLRDPADVPGARLAIQGLYENAANPVATSNLSAVDLPIPPGGLVAPVTETEYLCFYDATSWPQTEREALRLPPGCGPVATPGGPGTPAGPGNPAGGTPPGGGPPPPPPPPPPPVAFHSFDIAPAAGKVLVRLPGGETLIPLTDAEGIPLGTVVDATDGTVRLTSARDAHGKTQTGLFYGGVFRVTQVRARSGVRGGATVILTVLTLVGPLPRGCPARLAGGAGGGPKGATAVTARGHGAPRKLWGNAKGNFRTVGHDASATVRGTVWLTEDTCAGTLVRVAHGVVDVADFPHHRSFLLRAPHGFRAHPGHGG